MSMKRNIGLGFRTTRPKSRIETPMPLTSVRKANSGVTMGLSGMKKDASSRPRITPVGVRIGMKRSKKPFVFLNPCSIAEKRNIVSV